MYTLLSFFWCIRTAQKTGFCDTVLKFSTAFGKMPNSLPIAPVMQWYHWSYCQKVRAAVEK